jgi:hypothetical protein
MRATGVVRRRPDEPRVEHVDTAAPAQAATVLRVGAHDDPAERHADQLAETALAVAADYGAVQHADDAGATAGPVRRLANSARGGETSVDAAAVQRAASGGRSLDRDVRATMEAGFGRDLGAVRVHTGGAAAGVARSIDAAAFTSGQDVFFGAGAYRPGTPEGDHVIAHELAHTVQNGGGSDVHRYPATAMKLPVPWSEQTASVFRPGEGASGGVYIMTTNVPGDPVKKAVAKPVFGKNGLGLRETGEQLVASDRVMGQLLGLKAPVSRVVRKGSVEFAELVKVCAPYQPARQSEEDTDWLPLAQAESFVVMSEVPNASSIGSLADKAGKDASAGRDLYRTLFNDNFLSQLGTMVVGDMLLGNVDRITLGAMNLGNIMLSMQDGRGELHAIDTAAFLPKSVAPHEVKNAGTNLDGRSTVRKHIDAGPGKILDDFMDQLVQRIKGGSQDAGDGSLQMWQIIDHTYKANRANFLSSFEFGWDSAMIPILALNSDEGRKKMNDTIGDARNDMVTPEALAGNAEYIGARAMGSADHDEAVGRPHAMNLVIWARAFDKSAYTPVDDELAPAYGAPDKKALRAAYTPPKALPTIKKLGGLHPDIPRVLGDGAKTMRSYPAAISFAHGEVDSLSPDKTKRGLLGKKTSQRPENAVGHAMVDAHAVIAGAGRAIHQLNDLKFQAEYLMPLLPAAKFTSGELAPVRQLLDFIAVAASALEVQVGRYAGPLGKVQSTLTAMTATDAPAVNGVAQKAVTRSADAKKSLADIRKLKLQDQAAGLQARA